MKRDFEVVKHYVITRAAEPIEGSNSVIGPHGLFLRFTSIV